MTGILLPSRSQRVKANVWQEQTPALTSLNFLHRLNLDRFGFSLDGLFTEVRHYLFRHHRLILEDEVIRDFTNMTACDQHTGMKHVGQVGKFLNDGIHAACDDNACIYQFFEGGFSTIGSTFKHPSETTYAHITGRYKEFGADLEGFVKEPHHIFFPLLHSNIIALGHDTGNTES